MQVVIVVKQESLAAIVDIAGVGWNEREWHEAVHEIKLLGPRNSNSTRDSQW